MTIKKNNDNILTEEELKKYRRKLKNLAYRINKDLGVKKPKLIQTITPAQKKEYQKWARRVQRQREKIIKYGVYQVPKVKYKANIPIEKKIGYLKGLSLHLKKSIYREPKRADYNELSIHYVKGGQLVSDIPNNPYKLFFIETGNIKNNIETITKIIKDAEEWINLYLTESPPTYLVGQENLNDLTEYWEELTDKNWEQDYELHKKIMET